MRSGLSLFSRHRPVLDGDSTIGLALDVLRERHRGGGEIACQPVEIAEAHAKAFSQTLFLCGRERFEVQGKFHIGRNFTLTVNVPSSPCLL